MDFKELTSNRLKSQPPPRRLVICPNEQPRNGDQLGECYVHEGCNFQHEDTYTIYRMTEAEGKGSDTGIEKIPNQGSRVLIASRTLIFKKKSASIQPRTSSETFAV